LEVEIGYLLDFGHRYRWLFWVGDPEYILFVSTMAFSFKGTDLLFNLSHWELTQQASGNWRLVVDSID
jgi:hypothetical protein